jgi:hypothetical protein
MPNSPHFFQNSWEKVLVTVPGDQVVLERLLGEFNDGLAEFELLR